MNCWIFDIDGVLTDPQQKKVVNHELWDQFTTWLQNSNPLTFNTGRSLEWVKQQILTPLESHLTKQNLPKSLLHNLMAVGEKGADWLNFDPDGNPHQSIDDKISVPQNLIDQVKQLTQDKFSDTMFFDDTKKTMISIEMKLHEDLNKFHEAQKQLVEELKKLVADPTLTIDATVIATDIQNTHTGKALGTKRIVEWLNQRNFQIDHYYTFGDSQSDLAMATYLYTKFNNPNLVIPAKEGAASQKQVPLGQIQDKKNIKISFIYVGADMHWQQNEHPFEILYYPGFTHGTMQFLSTQK